MSFSWVSTSAIKRGLVKYFASDGPAKGEACGDTSIDEDGMSGNTGVDDTGEGEDGVVVKRGDASELDAIGSVAMSSVTINFGSPRLASATTGSYAALGPCPAFAKDTKGDWKLWSIRMTWTNQMPIIQCLSKMDQTFFASMNAVDTKV